MYRTRPCDTAIVLIVPAGASPSVKMTGSAHGTLVPSDRRQPGVAAVEELPVACEFEIDIRLFPDGVLETGIALNPVAVAVTPRVATAGGVVAIPAADSPSRNFKFILLRGTFHRSTNTTRPLVW